MLSREVRRVPLDFDAPIGETWEPLLYHPSQEFPPCPTCAPHSSRYGYGSDVHGRHYGDGMTPFARQLSDTFYSYNGTGRGGWSSQLDAEDIEVLCTRKGRFGVEGVHYEIEQVTCECGGSAERWNEEGCEHCGDRGRYFKETRLQMPTPEEVNAAADSFFGPFSLDAIARWVLIEGRCQRAGESYSCPTCQGHGSIASEEEREAAEDYQPPKPPLGEGWQLWQTVSEGGPVSPVFETPDELAAWLSDNADIVGRRYSFDQWFEVITGYAFGLDMESGELV